MSSAVNLGQRHQYAARGHRRIRPFLTRGALIDEDKNHRRLRVHLGYRGTHHLSRRGQCLPFGRWSDDLQIPKGAALQRLCVASSWMLAAVGRHLDGFPESQHELDFRHLQLVTVWRNRHPQSELARFIFRPRRVSYAFGRHHQDDSRVTPHRLDCGCGHRAFGDDLRLLAHRCEIGGPLLKVIPKLTGGAVDDPQRADRKV